MTRINARTESWDQPCVVEAFGRLKKWVDNGWLVPDFLNVAPNDARMPMYLGDAAMVYEGPWFEGVLIGDQQDLGELRLLPAADRRAAAITASPSSG